MKEQEEDQEADKNPNNKQNQTNKSNRNQQMHHQRFLQKLPFKHQGGNSTIFVYRSSQGELYIFKAAQSDRSDRVKCLSNEFRVLQDIGQHSANVNGNQQNNNGAQQQQDNQNGNNNHSNLSDGQTNIENAALNQGNQQFQQQQILEEENIDYHPHIVKTYGYRTNFHHENIFYHVLILEFCPNGSLNNALDSMKEIFNPFSCDQSFQTFALGPSSATNQVQKLINQYCKYTSQSPQPKDIQQPHCHQNHYQNLTQSIPQGVFTTLNLQIHIQVVRNLIKQLVSAISFIHSRGYYHGDIKLANILLDNEFNLKLADFGTTSKNQSAPTSANKSNAQRGLLNSGGCKMPQPHIAPEAQREGKYQKYDGQKADIFSLGVVLFCLVFNQYPFNTAGAQSFQMSQFSLKNAWNQVQCKINYLINQHPSEDILNLIDLLTQMLDENPSKRPTIFEVEESSWMNSTEVISIPDAIKKVQVAQKQESQRILEELQNKQKQQINQKTNAPNISSQCQSKTDDRIENEEEKLNSQNSNSAQSHKDILSKEHYHIRLQEAKERQEKENLHTQPYLKVQEKETALSLQENSSLQNSGEAVD
ncbi:kinase domain protein (macronuclear) [Tetrahymena thermophila SB210]|uniref:non-specific serine/threonine protein kinase n=1 Tax=Tetrahymena thermophila (strain SB210) TaxID=312017 RepID=W7XLD5_TETTS|nr:kinase domain protein [Tetrahymena thermophila SB210]EWS76099.1 kinase domain protein [Tetrahymena thermophila SB210]|eukprot:XP_012651339.1 kinase domain protein [Tetrahymena thermophila SB210]